MAFSPKFVLVFTSKQCNYYRDVEQVYPSGIVKAGYGELAQSVTAVPFFGVCHVGDPYVLHMYLEGELEWQKA